MREFASSIGKKNFFTFGEVASNEEELARYTGRFAGDPDDLVGVDASLDFPLFFTLPSVIKGLPGHPPINLANLYEHRKNVQRGGLGQGAVISSHGEASRFFLPFLDNHDQRNRFRFVDPANPSRFDDQLTMAVGCLFGLQGIPVLYYGTEQGLHGAGDSDQNVREALWGREGTPFDTNNPFYQAIREIAAVRAGQPALRYGRQYFRQISGSGLEFGISQSAPGIIALSRILNDMEVVVVANAFTNTGFSGFALVDFSLNPDGSSLNLLYSNKGTSAASPGTVITRDRGTRDRRRNKRRTLPRDTLHPATHGNPNLRPTFPMKRLDYKVLPVRSGASSAPSPAPTRWSLWPRPCLWRRPSPARAVAAYRVASPRRWHAPPQEFSGCEERFV